MKKFAKWFALGTVLLGVAVLTLTGIWLCKLLIFAIFFS